MFLTGDETNFYVGSTKNTLNDRVLSRRGYIRQRIKKHITLDRVSNHFKDNLYDICIELIFECECETKQEQFSLEANYIKQLNPPLNEYVPYRSPDEKKQYTNEKNKEYAEKNKDKLRAYDNERNRDRQSLRNQRRRDKVPCVYCEKLISRGNISTHKNSCKNKTASM